jgi:hypothetical protein
LLLAVFQELQLLAGMLQSLLVLFQHHVPGSALQAMAAT